MSGSPFSTTRRRAIIFPAIAIAFVVGAVVLTRVFVSLTPPPPSAEANAVGETAEFAVGKNGRIMYVNGRTCGRDVVFLVDTNASFTVLDESFEPLLGAVVDTIRILTTGDQLNVALHQAPEIQLGSLRVTSETPVICQNLGKLHQVADQPFDAALGMDFLSQFVVDVDFDEGALRLSKTPPAVPGDAYAAHLIFDGGVSMVEMQCGTETHRFRIDTGSTDNCIEQPAFDHMIRSNLIQEGPSYMAATASGPVRARCGLLRSAQFGHFAHRDLLVTEGPMSILGMPFLARYHVTLDYPRGVAYFRPSKRFAEPELLGTSGVAMNRVNGSIRVLNVRPGGPADGALYPDDEVVAINREPAPQLDMFRLRELLTAGPGAPISVQVSRGGTLFTAEFKTRDRLAR